MQWIKNLPLIECFLHNYPKVSCVFSELNHKDVSLPSFKSTRRKSGESSDVEGVGVNKWELRRSLTWNELKSRSQKRRMRRSMEPLGTDSSMTKVKRMAWIPSRGMRVRVDLANLEQWRKGTQRREELTTFVRHVLHVYRANTLRLSSLSLSYRKVDSYLNL